MDSYGIAGATSAGREVMLPSQASTECYDVQGKAVVRPKRDGQKNCKCQAEQAAGNRSDRTVSSAGSP